MSDLRVAVTTVDDVKPHPNADRLDLAVVGGWQCVVAKDVWKAGDLCVYFPPDTVLPPETSDALGITQYLSKGRIRHVRLRGEASFGVIAELPPCAHKVGDDVAGHYGATKYEPPQRTQRGQANRQMPINNHPLFRKYTEIDNLRHFPNAFVEGEMVYVTEKIHGANCRVGIVKGEFMAGSRRLQRRKPKGEARDTSDDATYWWPFLNEPGVKRFLESFLMPQSFLARLFRRPRKSYADVVIYGEIYGPSIQSYDYGLKPGELGFVCFDIMIDGNYLSHGGCDDICYRYRIPMAPLVSFGPYSIKGIEYLSRGISPLGGKHMREGVVVRPQFERRDPAIGRLVLKYVSDEYLLDEKKTDFVEE